MSERSRKLSFLRPFALLGCLVLPGAAGLTADKIVPALTKAQVSVEAGRLAEMMLPHSIPATPLLPAHLRFTFDEDGLSSKINFRQRQLLFIPVEAYRNQFQKPQRKAFDLRIKFLKGILQSGSAGMVTHIPVFPAIDAPQVFRSQVEPLNFQGGSGVRFITRHAYEDSPVTNENIFYTFQGLTKDGAHLVCFFHPISATNLPITEDTSFASLYLNQLEPSQFIPNLDQLDAVIRSIQIR